MRLPRGVRQTLTIARRDFTATVFTPAFLIFLLVPIIMFSLGPLIGISAAGMASESGQQQRVAVIASADHIAALRAADQYQREVARPGRNGTATLMIEVPQNDPARQARALFDSKAFEVSAALYGPFDRPTVLHRPGDERSAVYLAHLVEQMLRAERSGGTARLSVARLKSIAHNKPTASGRVQVAFLATFALFFLNIMLSGQAVGTMAEERGNKVLEILTAAVPLESVFLGKLIAMFGTSVLFLTFWGTILGNLAMLMPPAMSGVISGLSAAVGPAFPLLFFAYFTTSYMLLGGVFLTVGAQAATPREIQLYSLPITIFMVAMFGFATFAAGHPGSWVEMAAIVFPFSSPFAMVARGASQPELWPHFAALGWQIFWVATTITLGARWFRRGVLQSGSPRLRLRQK